MKYFLFGESNSENLGDQVICNVSRNLYKRYHPNVSVEIVDISMACRNLIGWCLFRLSRICHVNFLFEGYAYLYTCFRCNRLIEKGDCVVFVGGQLFMDYFMPSISAVMTVASKKGINVYFNSIGTSNLLSRKYRSRLSSMLNSAIVKRVTLRDGVETFRSTVAAKALFVPDIAICSYSVYGKDNVRKEKIIGWGVIDVDLYNLSTSSMITKSVYLSESESAIKSFVSEGFIVEIFTNGSLADYKVADSLYRRFEGNNFVKLSQRPKTDVELVQIIRRFTYVVASRLHALILSYSFRIPCFGLSWDNKVEDFFKYIGYPSRVKNLSGIEMTDWCLVLKNLSIGLDNDKFKVLEEKVISQIKSNIE